MSNMYDILGKLKSVMGLDEKPAEVKSEPIYESVEPRGDIMEAVKSLEEKYMGFKKTVAAVKKGGSAEDPAAVAASIGRKKYGKKKFQKAAAAGKKLGESDEGISEDSLMDLIYDILSERPRLGDNSVLKLCKQAIEEDGDVFTNDDVERIRALLPQVRQDIRQWNLGEAAKPDYIDLDKDGDKKEPMKKAAKDAKKVKEGAFDYEDDNVDYSEFHKAQPANPDTSAIEKRKRLQAIKDRQEAERAEHGGDYKSNVRTVKGKAYGGAAQKDAPETDDLDEVAPPGAKAERMVKHIKKGYAKDGKLTKREKGIAYATAWKAHNKGQVEEGTQFGDTIENSKAELTKAKKVKVTESRMIQEGDYFYEKLGKALAEKNPTLNTADSSFVTAVRQEMVAQGIEPNRARNIIMMDDDFIGDVATSYGHYCKEIAECNAPINSHLGGAMEELDEIARLAGLPTKEATCEGCGCAESQCQCTHEDLMGEEEMDEGNEFTKARLDAIAAGKDTFTAGGKVHRVTGDTSSELNSIRRLSGLEEERDIEWDNTPEEVEAPISAAIPSGNDLHKAKKQDPKTANKAANPLAKEDKQVEESLWKKYEDMIDNLKA